MRTDADIFAAADAFNKRQLAGDLENTFSKSPADALASPSSTREALPDTKVTYPSGFWRQFAGLAWREFLSVTRNPYDVAARTITFCWVGAGGGQGGHAVLQRNVQGYTPGASQSSRVWLLICDAAAHVWISCWSLPAPKAVCMHRARSLLPAPLPAV
jgi:hypothetical protein